MTESDQSKKKIEDLSGRDRMTWNVISGWLGHSVTIVIGFVLPRMIDQEIGTVSLGIWDLCWSLVNYMSIFVVGSGSSVNRFVALSRSSKDVDGFARVVSSAFPIQIIVAFLFFTLTAILVYSLPAIYGEALGADIGSTQVVMVLLGSALAIQMGARPFRGVVTGSHRWDIHNGLQAAESILSATSMIAALLAGYGLIGLSFAYLGTVLIIEIIRALIAYRVCREMKIGRAHWDRSVALEMLLFDAKTMLAALPKLLVSQTTRLFIVGALGPVALAIFARPLALVEHIRNLINKLAVVVTPVAASLQGDGRDAEAPDLVVEAAYYSAAIALPMLVGLAMYGDHVMLLWMGPQFVDHELLAILVIGQALPIVQSPVIRVMMGLNLHGKLSVANLVVQLSALCAGLVALHFVEWTLARSAMLVIGPQLIGNIVILVLACRTLGISITSFYTRALGKPVLCALALAAVLAGVQWFVGNEPVPTLVFGGLAGGVITVTLIWTVLLNSDGRDQALKLLRRNKN